MLQRNLDASEAAAQYRQCTHIGRRLAYFLAQRGHGRRQRWLLSRQTSVNEWSGRQRAISMWNARGSGIQVTSTGTG
eukprot:3409076-Prymnesium_polylepis.1